VGDVVVEAGVIAGYVIAWAVRKARRAGSRLDAEADAAIDAGLDKLHEVVAAKLGGHPVLDDLDEEAGTAEGQISELTRQQVELAITAAARKDDTFGQAVTSLLARLRASEQATGQSVLGHGGVNVAGNVDIRADHGGAAAWNMGTVNVGQPPADPPAPGRSRD
jgi:hypothetical protein